MSQDLSGDSQALIDLYSIDGYGSSSDVDFTTAYFVPAQQSDSRTVEYVNVDGTLVTYEPYLIETSGFEITGSNKLPNPKIVFSNLPLYKEDGSLRKRGKFTSFNNLHDDLIGFRLTRIRTYRRFLRAIDGVQQSTYAPSAHFTPDQWWFNRKIEESIKSCAYELASVFDVEGIRFPRRRMYSNYCPWVFKGPECGYTGTSYNFCPKNLEACKERFGEDANLPFGGFPTVRYQ